MNESFNLQVVAEKAHDKYRMTAADSQNVALDNPVSQAMRAIAEENVARTREVYEHAKDALEVTLETLERSFDALGQSAIALNHKMINIAQRNIDSGLDLATSLAGAKNLVEVIELQAVYWHKQLGALTSQSEEMRTLSTQATVDSTEPIKDLCTPSSVYESRDAFQIATGVVTRRNRAERPAYFADNVKPAPRFAIDQNIKFPVAPL